MCGDYCLVNCKIKSNLYLIQIPKELFNEVGFF